MTLLLRRVSAGKGRMGRCGSFYGWVRIDPLTAGRCGSNIKISNFQTHIEVDILSISSEGHHFSEVGG